ncbi:CBO0543 family protein [Bacillus sp. EB600]|uniref:CBO0543 family protein n=1 Tax=Bacillus sp. EB600 TaxID=2806345 RepID=UPI00210E55AC|nr:CBO0543 family protein [Bacillus sp. EB600]MCQ6281064.1 hypothetical protein [Bacillus sp. EB600]
MDKFRKMENTYDHLRKLWFDYGTQEVVFTYQWWIEIFVFIFSLFLWWRFVDKTRLKEISLVGLITAGIAFILDQIGTSLDFWIYPYTLTPLERDEFAPADLSIIPFIYSMIYQRYSTWKKYIIATIIYAFFASYIGENIFQWLGIYKIKKWNHLYSVPLYILIGIFVKAVLQKFNSIESHFKNKE